MGSLNFHDPRLQPPREESRFWKAFRAGAWGFIGGALFGFFAVPSAEDSWFAHGICGLVSGAAFAAFAVLAHLFLPTKER